jgi:cell division protein FtsI/penicillin-binding protein 2
MVCVLGALLTSFVCLSVHLYKLQICRHAELYAKARQKYTSSFKVSGTRGKIRDVQGNLLAGNLACRDIFAEPRRFRDNLDQVVEIFSQELNLPEEFFRRRFARALEGKKPVTEVVVKRGVDIDACERLKTYKFHGLRYEDSYRRFYPKGALMSNLLGFTNADGVGVTGVEQLLDRELQPVSARTYYERDRSGNMLEEASTGTSEVRDGNTVYLTLDEPIQQIVESELVKMVDKFAPRAAYALMANPKTGAVMALAQYPSFNPNARGNIKPDQWQNRILLQGFEPGSVMKPMAVAGALDYGVVNLDTQFDCEKGRWLFQRKILRDSGHSYEILSVREIIQKSSNIGTAKIALRMGEGRLYQTLRRFGFGQKTGIGFANEATGIFRPLPKWDGLSISRFPIGQGILVTPLQLVQGYCALANGGVMMQLRVVDRIENPKNKVSEVFPPKIKARVVRPPAAREIIQAMKLVTRKGGTATQAAVKGYDVAGKTGTGQKVVDGVYSHSQFVASFIGFVPAENPAFVLLVVADVPSKISHYGGTVAGPTFSRISEKTLRYLQVAPANPANSSPVYRMESLAYAQPKDISRLP